MLKNNFLNIPYLTFITLFIGVFSLSSDLIFSIKIFWFILFIVSLFLLKIKLKFKSLLIGAIALSALYIQLILNQYVMSEEFFINCLGVLIIIKFSELNDKNNLLSFNLICIVIAIASLIKGQDIISTLTSIALVILIVVNMYLIQQKEILDLNLKNIFKYLGFGLSIFPFIIIFYLIFPRAEINFKIFDQSTGSLGIPDTINLGSFSEFSNSEEEIFKLINNNYKKEDLYFRVKVFDFIEDNKSWRPSSGYYLFNQFKNSLKINNKQNLNESYEIILEPYKKKWIPSLKNSKIASNFTEISEDYFNQTFISRNLIDRNKQVRFEKIKTNISLGEDLRNYYVSTPKNISYKLKKWVSENNNSTQIEFLNKIYKRFSKGDYYYNLNPQNIIGNDYESFFFDIKEGYCEHYAATFVLLARLANIPSRIVTGYYGGELNDVGNFYSFKQKDTHAWAEIWLEDKGWVRIDPTKAIPDENVKNTLNNVINYEDLNSKSLFSSKYFQRISYYFSYVDFIWTKHLLSYDNEERKNFIKNILNFNFSKIFVWIFAPIIFFILIKIIFNINSKNLMKLYLYLLLIGKRKKLGILKSDTLEETFNKFNENEKIKYRQFFQAYEINKYSRKNFSIIETLRLIF